MKIAVASGKGGTGKTSVAVNLALSLGGVQVLDCDVEEPNAHILLRPEVEETIPVEVLVPRIIEDRCDYCGECARFCQYNALFVVGETAMVFPELCHSCGGCSIVCPRDAIVEEPRQIGRVLKGSAGDIDLVYGEINVGEPLSVPVISAVKKHIREGSTVILDAPPGTACPVVETVHGADFCLLVTEPTPFGLHDLQIAVEVVRELGVSMGVVVNFAGIGDRGVYDFCEKRDIPIMMEIPFDRRIAELYSRGTPFVAAMPEWKKRFMDLAEGIGGEVGK
ncbi:MAG: ATP-binding protein [Candidatus Bathyarchaeota archaeon]|nr:ATP-binding protein [Candidatus Bathyarchaeota archaeon]